MRSGGAPTPARFCRLTFAVVEDKVFAYGIADRQLLPLGAEPDTVVFDKLPDRLRALSLWCLSKPAWAVKLGYKNVYRYPGGIFAWKGAKYPAEEVKEAIELQTQKRIGLQSYFFRFPCS